MNNLQAHLESRFHEYYKAKTSIGKPMNAEERQIRVDQQNMARKQIRTNVLFDRRNISAMEALTPNAKEPSTNKAGKADRMMLLKQWKADKENRLKNEKAKKKPIFQTGGRANIGFPGIEDSSANKTKRATRSAGQSTTSKATYSKKSLDPKDSIFAVPRKLSFGLRPNEGTSKFTRVTRSQKPVAALPLTPELPEAVSTLGRSKGRLVRQDAVSLGSENVLPSIEAEVSETMKTPENTKRTSVYVSPFVTTSRGKGSVRKENLERSVRGLPSFTKHNTPDKLINSAIQATGAAYFHTVLSNEITRLLSICDTWNEYKQSDDVPADARDMIDVAVGQANLLVNKKFQQFRGLIVSCENGDGEQPVTCEDLQGFWDMVYIQVENLNARFNRLTDMKNNSWEEIQAEVKSKAAKKRAPLKRAKSVPSGILRAAIRDARIKSQQSQAEAAKTGKESVFHGGFFVVRSPHKETPPSTSTKKRRSLLESVLSAETSKRRSSRVSSPGVTMMKASQTAKSIENIAADSVKEFALPTPGRSILKSAQNRKSNWNTSKVVLFQDESNDEDAAEHHEQNKSTSNFIVEDITEKTPKRKSRRSSVKK